MGHGHQGLRHQGRLRLGRGHSNSRGACAPLFFTMAKTFVYSLQVMFGDCDPAGIAFYPNFLKWMDASSHHFFLQCGLPPFSELEKTSGIVGHPLLEIQTRFHKPATYGETLSVHTCVDEWREKVFVHQHVIQRGDVVLCEGREVRTFVTRHPDNPSRLRSIPIPQDIMQRCQ